MFSSASQSVSQSVSVSPTLSHRNTPGGLFAKSLLTWIAGNLPSLEKEGVTRQGEKANMHLYIIRAGGCRLLFEQSGTELSIRDQTLWLSGSQYTATVPSV